MRAHPPSRKKKAYRLRTRALWLCLLASLSAIAMGSRPALRAVFAQSSAPQTASQQDSTKSSQGTGAQARPQETPEKPETQAPASTEARQKQIAEDSANLLKLVDTLKFDVDKTTADTFSVTAIREAQEIEKLAHKMRTR